MNLTPVEPPQELALLAIASIRFGMPADTDSSGKIVE